MSALGILGISLGFLCFGVVLGVVLCASAFNKDREHR